ncbi:MAG: serine hydrolase domain-containing protein, partial [Methyloligellaceae bacterium]
MLNTKPLRLQDGWPVANLNEANLDAQSMSGLTRWIGENYEYHKTHAVLIAHAGHLVYEVYLEGQDSRWNEPLGHRNFNVDSLHDLQSVSKSVTSLLLGLALRGGYERALVTPVTEFFKDQGIAFGEGVEKVTLQHVLTMTAGFEWDVETFPYEDPRNDNHKLFESEHDPVAFVLGLRVKDKPGTVWNYNNGLTEVLAAIIEQKTGKRLDEYAAEALFEPLGITSFEWVGISNWMPNDRPTAAGGLRMRARDLAKIGSLVLHNGVWNGKQIVSPEWIRLSSRRHVAEVDRGMRGDYGYG